MKRSASIILTLAAIISGCTGGPVSQSGEKPSIWPDYTDVTVPADIAPLRFEAVSGNKMKALFETAQGQQVRLSGKEIAIPRSDWKRLTAEGGIIKVTLAEKQDSGTTEYQPFDIVIAPEGIDSHIAYRLIEPGYEMWNKMGIYQRKLSSFRQTCIAENSYTEGNCMNCHSFCDRNAGTMLFHMRASLSGTYIMRDGELEKLNTKTPETISALVYPSWHPSGRYVAFSVNDTKQAFHSTDPNRVEVYDIRSDVVVYDVENHQVKSCPELFSKESFETFPTFSPDGKTLYVCSSYSLAIPEDYDKVCYNLCSIEFDAENCSFGDKVDTLYRASKGHSASFPRVSPDGKMLVFTISGYGNFSIWHKDADLYSFDLEQFTEAKSKGLPAPIPTCMESFNSNDVESYHSWSSNSRWLIFSSRRDDGLYTRPYIGYVAPDGTFGKPFLLPARHTKNYKDLMKSFNIPEFVDAEVSLPAAKLKKASRSKGIDLGFEMQ